MAGELCHSVFDAMFFAERKMSPLSDGIRGRALVCTKRADFTVVKPAAGGGLLVHLGDAPIRPVCRYFAANHAGCAPILAALFLYVSSWPAGTFMLPAVKREQPVNVSPNARNGDASCPPSVSEL